MAIYRVHGHVGAVEIQRLSSRTRQNEKAVVGALASLATRKTPRRANQALMTQDEPDAAFEEEEDAAASASPASDSDVSYVDSGR